MLKLILLLLSVIKVIFAHELQCDFVSHIDGYNCELKSSFDDTATSFVGVHEVNKTDNDVNVLYASIRNEISVNMLKFH
jgi:hypothetical protein